MNSSNVTEHYDNDKTPELNLSLSLNFSLTSSVTPTSVSDNSSGEHLLDIAGALFTPTHGTAMSPLVGATDGGWSAAVPLWLPYVIFTVVLLSLIVVSFARFHALRGAQYRNRQLADERSSGLAGAKNGFVPRGADGGGNPGQTNGLFSTRATSTTPSSSSVLPPPPDYLALFLEFSRDDTRFDGPPSSAAEWNATRRIPTRTRSDDLTTVGRPERRTSRSSHRKPGFQRSSATRGSSQRPLAYAYNDNGSMVDVRCEPAEWTNTFRLLTTVKDDDEMDAGEDSVVIVLQESTDQLDVVDQLVDAGVEAAAGAADSRRRRWRDMPVHMRTSVDGSGQSSSVASSSGRPVRNSANIPRPISPTSPSCRGRTDPDVSSTTATPNFRSRFSDSATPTILRAATVSTPAPGARAPLRRHDATYVEDTDPPDVTNGCSFAAVPATDFRGRESESRTSTPAKFPDPGQVGKRGCSNQGRVISSQRHLSGRG